MRSAYSAAIMAVLAITSVAVCVTGRAPKSPSIAVGAPFAGKLRNGEVLPSKGSGYFVIPDTKKRRHRFGTVELVMAVKHAAWKVRQRYPGSRLAVADLSRYTGGRIPHHASHQNGRDVDLLFFTRDAQGRPTRLTRMVPFDKNGFSIDPPMQYRFDDARNFALVRELLRSPWAQVQYVFVADHLKQRLLAYGRTHGAPRSVLAKMNDVLRQPSRSAAHTDHFHVRIYCPPSDLPWCKDKGIVWPWIHR